MTENINLKSIMKLITGILTLFILLFIFHGLKIGLLQDKTVLISYMKQLGFVAPLFFVFLQIFQVIIPIIPGGASCLAGVIAFGSFYGFIYNYIGLSIGSFFAFYLSRKYGLKLIEKFFKEETIQKYLTYIGNDQFYKIFFLGIFLPGLPDDLLCYIAGISKMDYKTFLLIILIGKPFTLIMYSFFFILF